MTAFRQYLLKLILCGLLYGLAQTLLQGKKAAKAVALCGGCLIILTAVRPLMQVDFSKLPDLVSGLTRAQKLAEAKAKNDALLQKTVEEQTERWIVRRAGELGIKLEAEAECRASEAGSFVPYRLRLRGSLTDAERDFFSAILAQELDVPPERQDWEGS